MKYAQQSSPPAWFDSDLNKIYEKAAMGTSPFNEWYEFDDRKDAIHTLAGDEGQSFIDDFSLVGDEIYNMGDITWDENTGEPTITEGAKPASLASIIDAQSRF